MVRALIADGRNKKALPLLQELVSLYTGEKKKEWSRVLLYQYLELTMNEKACRLALRMARHYPVEEQWWRAVAHTSLEQDRMEEALMAMTILSFIRPLNAQETRLLADLNLQTGIPGKALPVYEKLLESSVSPVLLKYVVYACRRLGNEKQALALLEKYRDVTRKDFNLLLSRADLLYSLSMYQQAHDAYIQATRFSISCKDNPEEEGRAWFMAGYCAWQRDDLKSAIKEFSMAAQFSTQRKKAVEVKEYLKKMLKAS